MPIDVSLLPYETGDFDALTGLYASYFSANDRLMDARYLSWQYVQNPHGRARLVLAHEGSRLVAAMALVPARLVKGHEELLAYYVVNVLVHPEWQGRHVFGKLVRRAIDFVRSENAALMGHPNALALAQWRRSRMVFHAPLKPSLVLSVPWPFAAGGNARELGDIRAVEPLVRALLDEARGDSQRWRVNLSTDYLQWRYQAHPANTYRLQRIFTSSGEPGGLTVTKKIRSGVNLLVDHFMLKEAALSKARLPLLTVGFFAGDEHDRRGAEIALPLRKRIPFFLTSYARPIDSRCVAGLGLSTSDF
ncbi:MAG: GNAT family N-acetyltransferase [Pseudomonadota bacterium]